MFHYTYLYFHVLFFTPCNNIFIYTINKDLNSQIFIRKRYTFFNKREVY